MNFIDICSGIGGFRSALEMNGHNCLAFAEIDKYAKQSYRAIYDTEGEDELDDITAITDEHFRLYRGQCDIITGGFPCQAFSIAGNRRGFDDTRGTIFFHIARAIKEIQPSYVLLENVKGLFSHDKGRTFGTIIQALDELGYVTEWGLFNSKYWGVPQNRERVYILVTRKDKFKGPVLFDLLKQQTEVTTRLIDVLEDEVDEKYYLSDEKTKKLTLNINVQMDNEKSTVPVLTPDRLNKRQNGRRFKEDGKPMFTLTSQDRHGIAVREATKQGYALAEQGDSVNVSYPTSKTRRGRVGKQVAQTLQAGEVNQGVVINPFKNKTEYGWHFEQAVYDPQGITRTVKANGGSGNIPKTIEGNQGVVIGGGFDDKEIERNTFEILQTLQKEIGEKEIAEWRSRILDTFQQEEILRQDVYEKGLDIEQDEKKFERKEQSCECEVKNRTFDKQERMREMPIDKEFRCSSHGRESIQQFARELTSVMQKLSHETSQEKSLYRLRKTTQGIRLLRKALSEIQEIWRSSLHEIQTIRIRKLVPIETWRLQGFTDEQFYKAKDSGVSNSQLYKQAGNSVSVPVVDAIVKCL
mgnify:CR=1 FL=1